MSHPGNAAWWDQCHQNSFFNWEPLGYFFPQRFWSLCRKEKPRGGILGQHQDTPIEGEKQRELFSEVPARVFLPARRKARRTALIVSLVSSDHVAKCFGSIPVMPICGQVLAALLRPIFYRETVQGPVWALPAARQEGSLEFLVSVSGHWSQALWRLQGHYL